MEKQREPEVRVVNDAKQASFLILKGWVVIGYENHEAFAMAIGNTLPPELKETPRQWVLMKA